MDTLSELHLGHKTISFKEIVGTGKKEINFSDVEVDKAKPCVVLSARIFTHLPSIRMESASSSADVMLTDPASLKMLISFSSCIVFYYSITIYQYGQLQHETSQECHLLKEHTLIQMPSLDNYQRVMWIELSLWLQSCYHYQFHKQVPM